MKRVNMQKKKNMYNVIETKQKNRKKKGIKKVIQNMKKKSIQKSNVHTLSDSR